MGQIKEFETKCTLKLKAGQKLFTMREENNVWLLFTTNTFLLQTV